MPGALSDSTYLERARTRIRELEAELAKSKGNHEETLDCLQEEARETERLRAELAAARQDSERLDALEDMTDAEIVTTTIDDHSTEEPPYAGWCITVEDFENGEGVYQEAKLRDAIDAAIDAARDAEGSEDG